MSPRTSSGETSQTLDRGLTILRCLAGSHGGSSANELAAQLGVDRAIVYRLLRTLESHHFVRNDSARFYLGTGVTELAGAVRPQLQAAALPILAEMAERAGATSALSVADGEEAVVLLAVEPRTTNLHVAYRTGFRHPLDRSAAGTAILASRPPSPSDRAEVVEARRLGYAVSHGELQEGAWGISVPVHRARPPACVTVIALAPLDVAELLPGLQAAADHIAAAAQRW